MRTTAGQDVFNWLSDRINEFMAHTDAGSKFVFDEAYTYHLFAMKVSHYYACVNISSFLRFIQHHCSE